MREVEIKKKSKLKKFFEEMNNDKILIFASKRRKNENFVAIRTQKRDKREKREKNKSIIAEEMDVDMC